MITVLTEKELLKALEKTLKLDKATAEITMNKMQKDLSKEEDTKENEAYIAKCEESLEESLKMLDFAETELLEYFNRKGVNNSAILVQALDLGLANLYSTRKSLQKTQAAINKIHRFLED